MKKNPLYVLIPILLCGCASYAKTIQLNPQKVPGWKKISHQTYKYACNEGEVQVHPIVLRYESMGGFNFFIPIPDSKEELRKANEKNAGIYVVFRDSKRIESCDLAYLYLVDQTTGDRVAPRNSEDMPINGMVDGKYAHTCFYYFDLNPDLETAYKLHVAEELFDCAISPILYKKEKSFEYWPTQLM